MRLLDLLALALLLTACTPLQRETSAHEWQMTECNRMVDQAERQRCIRRVDGAYGTGAAEQRTPSPR